MARTTRRYIPVWSLLTQEGTLSGERGATASLSETAMVRIRVAVKRPYVSI